MDEFIHQENVVFAFERFDAFRATSRRSLALAATSNPDPPKTADLPAETIEFAHRMFDAAREGETELLSQALNVGLPPNLTNERGNTLLMLAAYIGHAELVQVLLDKGADPNRINDRGQSPIAGAVFEGEDDVTARMFGQTDILEVLGANEEDMKETTPLPPGPPAADA
ncbi:ankyrin [Obba rivulosa]|uniref:Ankyrin n=1 Tax=Obba rivulosa TaxID=1052685 RepID=A0A8E2AJ57_9APHY|nr:ankyrin [Obba rivulosa]